MSVIALNVVTYFLKQPEIEFIFETYGVFLCSVFYLVAECVSTAAAVYKFVGIFVKLCFNLNDIFGGYCLNVLDVLYIFILIVTVIEH
jgi:Mn2+/Fe2+ NRAMP family transporter